MKRELWGMLLEKAASKASKRLPGGACFEEAASRRPPRGGSLEKDASRRLPRGGRLGLKENPVGYENETLVDLSHGVGVQNHLQRLSVHGHEGPRQVHEVPLSHQRVIVTLSRGVPSTN